MDTPHAPRSGRGPAPRRAGPLLLALVLLPLLGACPDKPKPRGRPDTLVVQMEVEPPNLLPLVQPDFWSTRITRHNVFESLVRLDPRSYQPVGELCTTWKRSKDGKTYTFYLRQGVRWHDGKPLTGEDVRFTFAALLDESVRAASMRASLGSQIARFELEAADRFRVELHHPSPFFLTALSALDILPKHIYGVGSLNTHPALRKPLGSGPYRFVSWQSGQRIVLERFDGYWGEAPRIKRLVYRKVGSPDLALKLAQKGELDFVPRVRPADWVGRVQKSAVFRHEFVRTSHYPPGTTYIVVNHRRAPFTDRRVRLALAKLLDLDTVVGELMHGLGKRVGSLYWLHDPDYNAAVKPIAYDPQGAARLLAEAGYTDSDENGVLDKGGEPLRFTYLWVTASRSQKRWLTLYQQALRRAGVVMEISPIDWPAYLERIRKHDFDMGALGMRLTGPHTDLYEQLHSSQIADGQNYGAYQNPAADRLLEQVRRELNPQKRRAAAHKLQRLLAEDVALIPLFAELEPGIVARRVHGVYTSALWFQLRDWWLE